MEKLTSVSSGGLESASWLSCLAIDRKNSLNFSDIVDLHEVSASSTMNCEEGW